MDTKFRNILKKYNDKKVLEIDDLTVKQGEIVSIVGNNGAGKTTTFRLMLDLIKATAGLVTFGNFVVSKSENWKKYVGAFLDNDFLIDFLRPEEYFNFVGSLYSMKQRQTKAKLLDYSHFFNDEIMNNGKLIRELSSGNKQKVGIVSALMHDPQIIILDEPYNMIDPTSKLKLNAMLKRINAKHNTTIFISSNILEPVMDVSTRIILLEKGIIISDKQVDDNYIAELNSYFLENIYAA